MNLKRGSIVLLSLIMMSLIAFLAQNLMYLVYVGSKFDRSMVTRERSEMLALSGVDIAMAMLTSHEQEEAPGKAPVEGDKKKQDFERYFAETYPYLNRWNIYHLKKDIDGVDGEIGIYVSCENGKINLQDIFDFEKKELKKTYAPLLKKAKFQVARGSLKLDELLTEFFTKRQRGLDDPSELLAIKEFSFFDLFPDYRPVKRGEEVPEIKAPRVLFDLFTLWGIDGLDPLFLTDSTALFFGFKPTSRGELTEQMLEKYKHFASTIKQEWWSNWKQNLSGLKMLYDGNPSLEEGEENIFAKQFEPRVYSVVSFGLINGVKQRLFAVISKNDDASTQKNAGNEQNKEGKVKDKDRERPLPFKLLKLYWI